MVDTTMDAGVVIVGALLVGLGLFWFGYRRSASPAIEDERAAVSAPVAALAYPLPIGMAPVDVDRRAEREAMLLEHVRNGANTVDDGYIRPPQGPSRQDAGVGEDVDWTTLLVEAPFELARYYQISMLYESVHGDRSVRSIKISRLVEGPYDYYLRAYCFTRDNVRTFALRGVGPLLTEEGEYFPGGGTWLNSLPAAKPRPPEREPEPDLGNPDDWPELQRLPGPAPKTVRDPENEAEWAKVRATLELETIWPPKEPIAIRWAGQKQPVDFLIDYVLRGPKGHYLRGTSARLGGKRTVAVDRIEAIRSLDGVEFKDFWDWAVNRCRIARVDAEKWGLTIPPVGERR